MTHRSAGSYPSRVHSNLPPSFPRTRGTDSHVMWWLPNSSYMSGHHSSPSHELTLVLIQLPANLSAVWSDWLGTRQIPHAMPNAGVNPLYHPIWGQRSLPRTWRPRIRDSIQHEYSSLPCTHSCLRPNAIHLLQHRPRGIERYIAPHMRTLDERGNKRRPRTTLRQNQLHCLVSTLSKQVLGGAEAANSAMISSLPGVASGIHFRGAWSGYHSQRHCAGRYQHAALAGLKMYSHIDRHSSWSACVPRPEAGGWSPKRRRNRRADRVQLAPPTLEWGSACRANGMLEAVQNCSMQKSKTATASTGLLDPHDVRGYLGCDCTNRILPGRVITNWGGWNRAVIHSLHNLQAKQRTPAERHGVQTKRYAKVGPQEQRASTCKSGWGKFISITKREKPEQPVAY